MVLKEKIKVIKRDDTKDRRITRTKTKRQELLDEKAGLVKRVRQIERELQTA